MSLGDVAPGDTGQRCMVDHFKDAVFPTNRLAHEQTLEGLVGVHERHSQRVGKVLLSEWKLDATILDQARLLRSHDQSCSSRAASQVISNANDGSRL